MGGGKSQKGGRHGTIGRTLAHDILLRQSLREDELKKNMLKKKEYSVYERSDLDEFTMAAAKGLESYIAKRGTTREVVNDSVNYYGPLYSSELLEESNFPVIPIPRRSFFFTEEQKLIISKLNKQRVMEAKNSARKYFKRKNKRKVDMYMHGNLQRPYHGYYNKLHTKEVNKKNEEKGEEDEASEDEGSDFEDEESKLGNEDSSSVESVSESESEEELSTSEDEKSYGEKKYYYVDKYLKYLKEESSNIDITKLTPEDWENIELKNFYKWRSILSEVEHREKSVLTPYEKNLDFWRQLWRVIERSNLIMIILDSRDPLFFRIKDLENYIKEIDEEKQFLLLLNKADFLTKELRIKWSNYFKSKNIDHLFFSSLFNNVENNNLDSESSTTTNSPNNMTRNDCEDVEDDLDYRIYNVELLIDKINQYKDHFFEKLKMTGDEEGGEEERKYVVGCVGYPNVGKSSLINCLMKNIKTCVGIQPGKTKHIQTLHLNESIILCDCPGLIFPNLVVTKYHLLINNIISTSHFKGDMSPAIQLICNFIPFQLCEYYGIDMNYSIISIPVVDKETGENVKILCSKKFLEILCKNRNYISGGKGGQLDYTRACKLVINDYTQGVLLYCKEPPNSEQSNNHNKINSIPHNANHGDPNESTSFSTREPKYCLKLGSGAENSLINEINNKLYIKKTIIDSKQDEENVNQWLKQQLNQNKNEVKVTKRKMRFLIKGKRKTNT